MRLICEDGSYKTNGSCVEYWGPVGDPSNLSNLTCTYANEDYCGDDMINTYPYCDGQNKVGHTWACDANSGCWKTDLLCTGVSHIVRILIMLI